MGSSNSYIPASIGGSLNFCKTFANTYALNYAMYQGTSVEAATISAAVNLFDAKFLLAADPATRTKVTLEQRDEARASAENLIRGYCQRIKLNDGISDAAKVAIGVRPVNPNRTQRDCPQSQPILSALGAYNLVQLIRYADVLTPDSKALPLGAKAIQIFRIVNADAVLDVSQAQFVGMYTRNPIQIEYPYADHGKVVTYFGRWVGLRGTSSPWSTALPMSVAA